MAKTSSALLVFGLLLTGSWQVAWADTRYELRVDGLACPYCAYGVEKKLKALDGVIDESLQIKLNDGLVRFNTIDETNITEPELKKLINDSGFTLRDVTIRKSDSKDEGD